MLDQEKLNEVTEELKPDIPNSFLLGNKTTKAC